MGNGFFLFGVGTFQNEIPTRDLQVAKSFGLLQGLPWLVPLGTGSNPAGALPPLLSVPLSPCLSVWSTPALSAPGRSIQIINVFSWNLALLGPEFESSLARVSDYFTGKSFNWLTWTWICGKILSHPSIQRLRRTQFSPSPFTPITL